MDFKYWGRERLKLYLVRNVWRWLNHFVLLGAVNCICVHWSFYEGLWQDFDFKAGFSIIKDEWNKSVWIGLYLFKWFIFCVSIRWDSVDGDPRSDNYLTFQKNKVNSSHSGWSMVFWFVLIGISLYSANCVNIVFLAILLLTVPEQQRKNQSAPYEIFPYMLYFQILSDQYHLQDVLERSDEVMAVAKHLFGDAPRTRTGRTSYFYVRVRLSYRFS